MDTPDPKPLTRPVEFQRPTVEIQGSPLSEGFPVRHVILEVLEGKDSGKVVLFDRSSLRIGSDPLCDLALTDPTVSRNHAELRQRGTQYLLVDLGSTNGTYSAQGDPVEQLAIVPGDTFRAGRTLIRFDVREEKVAIEATDLTHYDNIIGRSQQLREIFSILDRVAPSELSVVIEGETGTGKELIARALHDHSSRDHGPFVVFDCSAFPPSLLESELFGHEKGAFTGAVGRHVGVFERAHGGTLFFDELGELNMEFQAKFLRVLETGQLRRVGGAKVIDVDVRMVAATNRNLKDMVKDKEFRADLFFRLAQVRFLLPALRDRKQDIPLLVEHFLEAQAERTGRRPIMEPNAYALLQDYAWPGNIRELRNTIEKAVALSTQGMITGAYFESELSELASLSLGLERRATPSTPGSADQAGASPQQTSFTTSAGFVTENVARAQTRILNEEGKVLSFKDAKEEIVSNFEQQYLRVLLDRTGHNISKAARQAGIDRRHLYRLLEKHEIEVE